MSTDQSDLEFFQEKFKHAMAHYIPRHMLEPAEGEPPEAFKKWVEGLAEKMKQDYLLGSKTV